MDLAAPELSANSGLSAVCFPGGPELGEGSAPPGCVADAPKMGWFSSFSQSCWVGGPLDALEGGSGLANTHLGPWGLHRGHPRLVERKRGGGGPSPSVAPSWGGGGWAGVPPPAGGGAWWRLLWWGLQCDLLRPPPTWNCHPPLPAPHLLPLGGSPSPALPLLLSYNFLFSPGFITCALQSGLRPSPESFVSPCLPTT